jgi:hypothetical protein
VERLGIGIGINRHGSDAELPRRADDATRDLPAIGDEEGLQHARKFTKFTPQRAGARSRVHAHAKACLKVAAES